MPTAAIDGVDLYYEVEGEGPPLVLVNGLGANLVYWAPVVSRLKARHTVVTYDHRGAGRSDTPPGPYSIARLTDDLIGLLDALAISRAIIVGHSMGGYVAMQTAAHHPARVDRLVLYSTAAEMSWPAARFIESVERVWTACPDIPSSALTRIFTPWSWSPEKLSSDGFVEMLAQFADENPYKMTLEGFRAQMEACFGFEGLPLLDRIDAPTLVIGGRNDLLSPLAAQQRLADGVGGARLVVSNAAHNTHVEAPAWFAEEVLGFTSA